MRVNYDRGTDALYIKLENKRVSKTVEFSNSFLVDLDSKKNVIGIEVLNYSKNKPNSRDKFSVIAKKERILIPA